MLEDRKRMSQRKRQDELGYSWILYDPLVELGILVFLDAQTYLAYVAYLEGLGFYEFQDNLRGPR